MGRVSNLSRSAEVQPSLTRPVATQRKSDDPLSERRCKDLARVYSRAVRAGVRACVRASERANEHEYVRGSEVDASERAYGRRLVRMP